MTKSSSDNSPDPLSQRSSKDGYQSFMVRIWHSDGDWRAVVLDPHSDQRKLFASREKLLEFMASQMGRVS